MCGQDEQPLLGTVLLPVVAHSCLVDARELVGPAEQVTQSDETVLAQEDATGLGAFGLELGDCADEELGVALRQAALLFDDERKAHES